MSHTDPFSYVQRSFPPIVGCLSSSTVEQICQKNNLSFVEMLRPFCLVDVDHRLRDPSGNDHPIQKLMILVQDVNDRPPEPSLAKKFLNESVNNTCQDSKSVIVGNLTVDIPAQCPWFQSWSNTFLQVQFPSDHEFCKHLLGCLLVTSSVDPPETLQTLLQSLQQMQATAPARLPKWFTSSIFKFYVLIHDSKDGNKAKALNFFNSLKTAYGADHCYFLEINSQQQGSNNTIPDYWVNCTSKRNFESDVNDKGSSPRTPAEIISITSMPNSVATETEVSYRSRSSPEIAQEAGDPSVSVVFHPLSPDVEITQYNPLIYDQSQSNDFSKVVNANVWNNLNNTTQFGSCLSISDVENIKSLLRHLILDVLFPHVEKQIFQLTDMASNKKGVSRSLLSATKRLFGTSKPGSPGSTPLNSVIYAYDAPELHYRRLGDLYFMFTNYSMAFQAYHSAKRDFGADQAWLYYAGALEMAALSAFMQGEVTKKGLDYMEEAILIYLNSCKLPQFATRATLLSSKFLKERHMYGEAAKQLIRMTSEDSDLRSALLLEQASYCFLYATKPNMSRKYAFHMVLAGHRFSKGGQKKHALRCYKQALQLYKGKGWSLAEDHIYFTVGKLAGHLKLLSEGSSSLASLLSSGSKQTPAQQETYLREYLQMLQQSTKEEFNESNQSLPVLPLPIIEDNSILVLVSSTKSSLIRAFEPDSPADSVRWSRMEELALTESQGPPMIFRPTLHLFSKATINTSHPVTAVNEPMHIQVSLKNPLQILLPMVQVQLLWNFTDDTGHVICNEYPSAASESVITTKVLDCIQLEPSCTQDVTFSLVPLRPGQINILGMVYYLTNSSLPDLNKQQHSDSSQVLGKQLFKVRGPKLKPLKDKSEVSFEKDKRLEIRVVRCAPLLKVHVEAKIASDMLCGEIQQVQIKLTNAGNADLKKLFMVTGSPHLVCLLNKLVEKDKTVNEPTLEDSSNEYNLSRDKNILFRVIKISLEDGILKGGQDVLLPLWIRAPEKKGPAKLDVLFYYENVESDSGLDHRISRCSLEMNVHNSIRFSAVASRSTLCENNDILNINASVQNLNKTNDSVVTVVSLVQISLASDEWKLHEKAIFSTEMKLKSQELYYLLIRAVRGTKGSTSVSDICFENKPVSSGNGQPYFDFYKWDDYNENQPRNSDLFRLAIFLRWNATVVGSNKVSRIVVGQSLVPLNQLGVTKAWPPEPQIESLRTESNETIKIFGMERKPKTKSKGSKSVHLENALSYTLVHDHKVTHCFQDSRICRVSMKLVIRSCVDFPVHVIVNSPDSKFSPSVVSKTQLYTPHSSSTFSWASRSNSLLRLEGHEQTKVPLSAVFTSPGTYDLGSRLSVAAAADGDADYVKQVGQVQSAIIITGKQSESS